MLASSSANTVQIYLSGLTNPPLKIIVVDILTLRCSFVGLYQPNTQYNVLGSFCLET